jgi:molybdopterin synthase sulfur carrier subunit
VTVAIRIPSALRSLTGGVTRLEVQGSTVAQVLQALEAAYPALVPYLRDGRGTLRPKVNIYVNDEHIRFRQGLQTPLQDGDEVFVMPLVMGG